MSDSSISVAGVGGDEASILQFEVRDELGRPLRGNPTRVEFALIASPGGGASLSKLVDTTDANGRVSTTVQSGTVSGVVKVRAYAGEIESKVVNLAIHGGPPDPEHFSIAAQHLNIEGLLRFGISDSVTAFVYDEYANPVPPGTAVYFTADHGGILGSAVTSPIGQATVVLYSAAPLPSCAEGGLVEVTARTVDGSDNTISTNTNVLFSGNTVIYSEPATFSIENGGYQDITVIVSDQCGNPLVAGSEIGISSSAGVLVGNVEVTLPDTQSPGYTQFWVRLSDGDSNETDPPTGQSITVEVTSRNGNAGFVIFGTMD